MTTSEGTLVEEHVHHWYIDSENIGRCACGEVRDFGRLLQRAGVFVAAGRRGAKARQEVLGKKRGRKKKEELLWEKDYSLG